MKADKQKDRKEEKEADDFEIVDTLKTVIARLEDWCIKEIKAPEGANMYYIKKVDNHIEIGYAKCELSC